MKVLWVIDKESKAVHDRVRTGMAQAKKRIDEGVERSRQLLQFIKERERSTRLDPEETKLEVQSWNRFFENKRKRQLELRTWVEKIQEDAARKRRQQAFVASAFHAAQNTDSKMFGFSNRAKIGMETFQTPKAHLDMMISKGRTILQLMMQQETQERRQERQQGQRREETQYLPHNKVEQSLLDPAVDQEDFNSALQELIDEVAKVSKWLIEDFEVIFT